MQLSSDTFFAGDALLSIETALALVHERVPAVVGIEEVALAQADDRVMAQELLAPIDLPGFDNSAVDGYALAHADLAATGPTTMTIAGRVPAGHGAGIAAHARQALRIFTGAPMPLSCDTVFMQEDVRILDEGRVVLPPGMPRGANVRPKGEDVRSGTIAIAAGRRLDPRDLALAAALGLSHLPVRRRPKVAIFSTGDEVREPGIAPLPPACLYDANRHALMAILRRAGCDVTDLGIMPDDATEVTERLTKAAGSHDLVVTSGGVSIGEEDHVRAAIQGAGSLVFWRLAIKPGRPVALGIIGGTPLVGLPGNPVAAFITWASVLRPLVAALAGTRPAPLLPMTVTAGFAYGKKPGRREYLRVHLERQGLQNIARKYAIDGTGIITSLTRTDGLLELAEDRTKLTIGEPVPFLDYRLLW